MTEVFNENQAARESVLQYVRTEIYQKRLQPGTPIDKKAIAEQLDVNEELMEEVMAGLVEEGLVEQSSNGQHRVVMMTKRLAQELMDLLGLLLVSAVDRLPEDYEQNAAVVTAAEEFSVAVLKGQENSEDKFRTFVEAIFEGTQNRELQRVGLPVVERCMSIIRLYDSEALLPMWADAFEQLPGQLEHSPKEAARHVREFFIYLVNEIEYLDPLPSDTEH